MNPQEVKPLEVGDQVTILPPYDDDPYIICMQHYATVTAVQTCQGGVGYMISLQNARPGQQFGPYPPHRLASGWRDEQGQWRVG